jgi:hypothetical protein
MPEFAFVFAVVTSVAFGALCVPFLKAVKREDRAMRSERVADLAERMAGWFFLVIGGVLLASSALAWGWSSPIACVVAVFGAGTLAFGAFAHRQTRVVAAMVVLALLQV